MDQTKFDDLTRNLCSRSNRRSVLRFLAGGTLGALAGRLAVDGADAAYAQPRCEAGKKRCGDRCIPQNKCCPGRTRSCYSGPTGTAGVGVCKAGTQTCQSDGTWGACTGQVTPSTETCNGRDDDCDGKVGDGALCPGNEACERGRCCNREFNSCTIDGTFACCDGLECRVDPLLNGYRCMKPRQ